MSALISVPTFAASSLATTGTGLDEIVDIIVDDSSLKASLPQSTIDQGATYADDIEVIFLEGLAATDSSYNAATGQLTTALTTTDIVKIEEWIRANPTLLAQFVADHGDSGDGTDEGPSGYHLVKGQAVGTDLFQQAAVNTVIDGMLHIGFPIDAGSDGALESGRIQNEDGAANATIQQLTDWYNYFLDNPATTGAGLDQITTAIMKDADLAQTDSVENILTGANSANGLNQLLIQAMKATGAGEEGQFTGQDIVTLNSWIRANALTQYQSLLGAISSGGYGSGGYQSVFDAGAGATIDGLSLTDVVAEGVYDLGNVISGGKIANENGAGSVSVGQIATWLNQIFYNNATTIEASPGGDHLTLADGDFIVNAASAGDYWIQCGAGAYTITTGAGDSYVAGGDGDLTLTSGSGNGLFYGGSGTNIIHGGGDDRIFGGSGTNELYAGASGSFVEGGSGTNYIYGGAGSEALYAGSGTSTIYAGTGYDEIVGGSGTDVIHGGASWDYILAGGGTTTIDGGAGGAAIYGGSGALTIIGGAGGLTVNAGSGATSVTLSSHGYEPGASGSTVPADVLTAGSGQDRFIFDLTLDASASVQTANAKSNGSIDWAKIAATNSGYTDSLGAETIYDFDPSKDQIAINGYDVGVEKLTSYDVGGTWVTYIDLFGQNQGASNVHVGSIEVLGDAAVTLANISVNGAALIGGHV